MKQLGVIAILVAVGCMVGNDSKNPGARFSERCEGAGSAYAQCAEDVGKDRDACYAGCADGARQCALEAAIGFAAGQIDCFGPVISQVITCKLCDGKTGADWIGCELGCAATSFDTFVRDPNWLAKVEACVANGAEATAVAENLRLGFLGALASGAGCVLAYGACTSADTIGPFELGSCDTLFTAGLDACETAQCNPAFCTCFDAQECPTIGGGASSTHMTGIVSCDTISVGTATTAQGTQVSCISFTNNAEPETCKETGWNPDGSFGNRGRFEACDSDAHCGEANGMALSCMDYDCDGHHHCDFSGLGGPGNCCELAGPLNAGCQDGYVCVSEDGDAPRKCVKEQATGTGSGG